MLPIFKIIETKSGVPDDDFIKYSTWASAWFNRVGGKSECRLKFIRAQKHKAWIIGEVSKALAKQSHLIRRFQQINADFYFPILICGHLVICGKLLMKILVIGFGRTASTRWSETRAIAARRTDVVRARQRCIRRNGLRKFFAGRVRQHHSEDFCPSCSRLRRKGKWISRRRAGQSARARHRGFVPEKRNADWGPNQKRPRSLNRPKVFFAKLHGEYGIPTARADFFRCKRSKKIRCVTWQAECA